MKKVFAIFAAAVLMIGSVSAQELANFARQQGTPVVSPEVKDGKVTFRLNATYATIGTEWTDKHYKELGEVVSSISKGINSANNEIEDGLRRLQTLKRALQDYLDA